MIICTSLISLSGNFFFCCLPLPHSITLNNRIRKAHCTFTSQIIKKLPIAASPCLHWMLQHTHKFLSNSVLLQTRGSIPSTSPAECPHKIKAPPGSFFHNDSRFVPGGYPPRCWSRKPILSLFSFPCPEVSSRPASHSFFIKAHNFTPSWYQGLCSLSCIIVHKQAWCPVQKPKSTVSECVIVHCYDFIRPRSHCILRLEGRDTSNSSSVVSGFPDPAYPASPSGSSTR